MVRLTDERSVYTNFFSPIKVIYRVLEAEKNNLEEKLNVFINVTYNK